MENNELENETKNVIEVIIEGKKVLIANSNPDLSELVSLILAQKDDFDYNKIAVNCSDDKFDKVSFKEILVDSITDFKKQSTLIENKYELDKNIVSTKCEINKKS